jgi:hypothetical protein
MKKLLKYWRIFYWIIFILMYSPYILNQEEFRGLIPLIIFIMYASPIFLVLNIFITVISDLRNKKSVFKSKNFWILITLLLLNLIVIFSMFLPDRNPDHALISSPIIN